MFKDGETEGFHRHCYKKWEYGKSGTIKMVNQMEDEMWWENGNKRFIQSLKMVNQMDFILNGAKMDQTKIQGFYVDGVIQDVEGFHPDGTPLKGG